MIKNVVFDLGGVVVAHNAESFKEKLGDFFSFVFGPDMNCVPMFWQDYDRGVLTIDETAAEVAKFRNCTAETAKEHMLYAISLQEEVEPTVKLIKELNSKKQEKPAFKAAYAEGALYVGADQLNTLAALKSKNELIADVIAALESPIMNVLNALENREEKAEEAAAE